MVPIFLKSINIAFSEFTDDNNNGFFSSGICYFNLDVFYLTLSELVILRSFLSLTK